MRKQAVIAHFGNQKAVAYALGITEQAVSNWGEYVPVGRAFQLEVITRGKLKASRHYYNTEARIAT